MTRRALPDNDHILQLLAERAVGDIAPADLSELERFLAEHPEFDGDALDHAAAAADVAWSRAARATLPPEQRAKLLAGATAYFAATRGVRIARQSAGPARPRTLGSRLLPLALAASVLLAAAGWWQALRGREPSPEQGYRRLVAAGGDLRTVTWQAKEPDYQPVTGDVVWSDARQNGYVRFAGLPGNDTTREHYQLWIIDPARDKNPVDAGVFDALPGARELFVPLRQRLPVGRPVAFAITREKRGGVVVTDGPILMVAPVQR